MRVITFLPLLTFSVFLGLAQSAQSAETTPGKTPMKTYARDACSPTEKWFYSPTIPKWGPDWIAAIPKEAGKGMDALVRSYNLKRTAKTPELMALGEYLVNRAFFTLNLPHYAHNGFLSMLKLGQTANEPGIRLAAIDCLNYMHRKSPLMKIPHDMITLMRGIDLSRLPAEHKNILYEAAVNMAMEKIAKNGDKAELSQEQALLLDAGPYQTLVVTSLAFAQSDWYRNADIPSFVQSFVNAKNLPPVLQKQRDALQLNLGRYYAQRGEYDLAVRELKKVSQDSNSISRAIIDRGWSSVAAKNFGDTASAAYNLMLGDLKNTFNPSAPIMAAIAFLENCQYPEALQAIKFFRKHYDPSYQWLYKWYQQNRKQDQDLYPTLMSYLDGSLKNKKDGVPRKVVSEWIRSPVFISSQEEINLLIDEKEAITRLIPQLEKKYGIQKNTGKAPSNFGEKLRDSLLTFRDTGIPDHQKALVARINRDLAFLNRFMVSEWADAYQNSQLIEVDIFNSTGEDLVRQNRGADTDDIKKRAAAGTKDKKSPSDDIPVLNWGKVSVDEDENAETWEDEVGFMKADIRNLCRGR